MTLSRRLTGVVAGAAGVALAATVLAVPATAAPATATSTPKAAPVGQTVLYDAKGSTFITKPGSTVTIAKTVLKTTLFPDGTFTAKLPIKPATASFTIMGLIPVTATVTLTQVGVLTGALKLTGQRITISSMGAYNVRLSNVLVAGVDSMVGDTCQTVAPIAVSVATPAGQSFNVGNGGNVTGTYTLGDFANCGLSTTLINQLVPGPNNTLALALSNGRFVTSS